MASAVEILRKENNRNDKKLTKENNSILTDIVVYLRSSDLCAYDIEIIRKELFGMIYEAQLRKEHPRDVIGEDYQAFCDELMASGRQKTVYEKLLERLHIGVLSVGILFVIEVLFSGAALNTYRSGTFTMPVTLGFAISTIAIIIIALLALWFFTRYSFHLSGSDSLKYQLLFIGGFTVFFTGTLLAKYFYNGGNLFYINYLYTALMLAVAYIFLQLSENRYMKRLAETHR